MPDRFIALNILPKDSLEELEKSLSKAQLLGFTHVWLNPLAVCGGELTRLDLDTGVHTTLYNSLYAVYSPDSLREPFTEDGLRALNKKFPKLKIMADFVWKHVSTESEWFDQALLSRADKAAGGKSKSKQSSSKKSGGKKPAAAAAAAPQKAVAASAARPEFFVGPAREEPKILKDIAELYLDKDNNPAYQKIMGELQAAVDVLLGSCGFAGLRLDAAAHFPVEVRRDLITYIRTKYPEALILEEVLFDKNQQERIGQLAAMNLLSDYVTSNLAFQMPSEFGALPRPDKMGDLVKLNLAALPISFTGNHDHFSLAWETLLTLAAQALNSPGYETLRSSICGMIRVSPIEEESKLTKEDFYSLLQVLASEKKCPASLGGNACHIFKWLVPLAHTIADDLCRSGIASPHYQDFRRLAHSYLFHRTLASPGGYFMLEADVELEFSTPRIFTNMHGEVLSVCNFTPKKLEGVLSEKIKKDELFKRLGSFFKNFESFKKNFKKLSDQQIAYVLFPYVLTYFRSLSKYERMELEQHLGIELKPYDTRALSVSLQWDATIKMVNTIFSGLVTCNSRDYETFVIKDDLNIPLFFAVIRRSIGDLYPFSVTDVIIMPYRADNGLTYKHTDLVKLKAWLMARRFPDELIGPLPRPFSPEAPPGKERNISPKHDEKTQRRDSAEFSGEHLSNFTYLHLGNIQIDPEARESILQGVFGRHNIRYYQYVIEQAFYNKAIRLFDEAPPQAVARAAPAACAAAAAADAAAIRQPWSPSVFSCPPAAPGDLDRSISLGRGEEGHDLGDEGQCTPPPTRRSPHSAPTSPEKPGKLKELGEKQVETKVIRPGSSSGRGSPSS